MFHYSVLLLLIVSGVPDEPGLPEADVAQTDPVAVAAEGRAFASRTLAVIDCILAQHIDPPPRQQLVLQSLRVLAREGGDQRPIGLGRRVSEVSDPEEIIELLSGFWREARAKSSLDPAELETLVLERLFSVVPGPGHFVAAKEHAVALQLAANRYVGIGIALTMRDKLPCIARVFEGGPAEQAGAREEDLIPEIDGEETAGKTLNEIIDLLRGPAGSKLTLVLQQEGKAERRTRTLIRGEVPLKTVFHERLEIGPERPVGYLRIESLTASTSHELRQLEPALNGVTRIVLDLRFSHGTDLHQTVLLADAFLDGGSMGRVRRRDGSEEFSATRDCLFRDLPLIVLVNRHTGGTLEWFAAALQDGRRATIAGEPTSGSAYVTESVSIPDRDEVLVLASGILERADGRPLVRPLDSPTTADFRPNEVNSSPSRKSAGRHDSGRVEPDVYVPGAAQPQTDYLQLVTRTLETVRSKLRTPENRPPE